MSAGQQMAAGCVPSATFCFIVSFSTSTSISKHMGMLCPMWTDLVGCRSGGLVRPIGLGRRSPLGGGPRRVLTPSGQQGIIHSGPVAAATATTAGCPVRLQSPQSSLPLSFSLESLHIRKWHSVTRAGHRIARPPLMEGCLCTCIICLRARPRRAWVTCSCSRGDVLVTARIWTNGSAGHGLSAVCCCIFQP